MLEYTKTILNKVAFDRMLFEKELNKALRHLMPHELEELSHWCNVRFGRKYGRILSKSFAALEVSKTTAA